MLALPLSKARCLPGWRGQVLYDWLACPRLFIPRGDCMSNGGMKPYGMRPPAGPLFDERPVHDYHNTTGLKGEKLRQREESAGRQATKVYDYFRARPNECLAAHEVHAALFTDNVPLTSTRRAITCLTTAGLLIKTDVTACGLYGWPVSCWRLKKDAP